MEKSKAPAYFAAALRQKLKESPLSQKRIAKEMGMSPVTLSRLANAKPKHSPHPDSVEKIVQYFGTEHIDLISLGREILEGAAHVPETAQPELSVDSIDNRLTSVERIMVELSRELDARKKAELKTKEYMQRLATAQELMKVGYFHCSFSGDATWSSSFYSVMGIDKSVEPVSWEKFVSLYVYKKDRKAAFVAVKGYLEDKTVSQYHITFRACRPCDKEIKTYREFVQIDRDAQGKPIARYGSICDITSDVLKSQLVGDYEQAFLTLLADSNSYLVVIEKQGMTVIHQNEEHIRIKGDLIGQKCDACQVADTFDTGTVHKAVKVISCADDETVQVAITSIPIWDSSGAVVRAVVVMRPMRREGDK